MKKTIFSGLLVITLLVFASCVPYEGQVNATQLQETLEGTYTLNFTVETSNNVKATNADPLKLQLMRYLLNFTWSQIMIIDIK